MALTIKQVPAAQGTRWVRDGFRTMFKRPLAFVGIYALVLIAGTLFWNIPVIGPLIVAAAMPLVSIGYMIATRSALQDGPVNPAHFMEPLSGSHPQRRRSMIALCAAYAVAGVAVYLISEWADGGSLGRLQAMMQSPEVDMPAMEAEIDQSPVLLGMIVRLVLLALISVPFWHAPALVHWGNQGTAQALFSSTVAVWRNRGAFAVYGLAWSAAFMAFGVVMALGMVLLGGAGTQSIVGIISGPVALFFSAAFYVSLLFTFNDSFGMNGQGGPDAADGAPPSQDSDKPA